MRQLHGPTLFLLGALTLSGCAKRPEEPTAPPSPVETSSDPAGGLKEPAAGLSVLLDKTKRLPPRIEWHSDIAPKTGGEVTFRVSCAAPVGITVVTDKGHMAIKGKEQFDRSDMLLIVDAKPPSYEGRVVVPAGTSWFIIENQSEAVASIRLECFGK